MTAEGRRKLRVLFKFGLLVSLPITGYVWALPTATIGPTGAFLLTIVSIALAFGAEGLASMAEFELSNLKTQSSKDGQNWTSEIARRDEKIRQMDRIIETLSNQNHDLRSKLVSVHSDMHRLRDEAEEKRAAIEVLAKDESSGLTAREIRDLMALRSRR